MDCKDTKKSQPINNKRTTALVRNSIEYCNREETQCNKTNQQQLLITL